MGSGPSLGFLAPFGLRSFRLQWPADIATSLAFEMETIALGWYVLVETGSVHWLTALGALRFHGTLVSPLIGVIGDRIGHRPLLVMMRGWYVAQALVLMCLALYGALTPLAVIVIAVLMGLVRPSDLAVRGATVAESVPAGILVSAMSISRSTSDIARIAGALAGAGLVATLGIGRAYAIVSALYVLGMSLVMADWLTSRAERAALASTRLRASTSPWRDLADGIRYVLDTPRLLAAMWLAFLLNTTTLPLSGGLLPFVAREVYGTNQIGLGFLSASFAGGALLGSLALGALGGRVRPARMMVASTVAWCMTLVVFAYNTSLTAGLMLMVIVGAMQSLSMVSMAIMLLKTSEEHLRGRVMGVRILAIFSQVIGLPIAGVMIGWIGFSSTALALAGGALVITIWITMRWQTELWPRNAVANLRSS